MILQSNTGWQRAVLMAAPLLLSACGGLGNGVLPVNAVIQPLGGLEGAKAAKAYSCLNTGISLFVDFNDGQRGDFTGRATYASSNPAVAQISNLDIPVPGQSNSFYSRGTIIAVAPGVTTITATYLTFTRTIEITVADPQNFRVSPASANLAARSRLDLGATADLDGVTTAIDAAVSWSFATPNAAVATIDAASGTVSGVAAGEGLIARASLPNCSRVAVADAPVTVANLQSLALTREFGARETLIVGTSERLIATGTLDNGATQDLSNQVSFTTSDATAVVLLAPSLPNFALAIKANAPVQIGASFANPMIVAPATSITPVADSITGLSLTPATVEVAAGQSTLFEAIGTYASGDTQKLTRHVELTSSDPTAAIVQTSSATVINSFAGSTATAATAGGKVVTVTASALNPAGQRISTTATLNLR